MMSAADAESGSIHASAVQVGATGILIRGPSGAGKSQLAFDLILAGRTQQVAAASLVGDDRVLLSLAERHVVARPAPQLAGLIEIRGLGIRRCDFVPQARIGLVVDLAAVDTARLPDRESSLTRLLGIEIPRIAVRGGDRAYPMVMAWLLTSPAEPAPPAAFRQLPESNW